MKPSPHHPPVVQLAEQLGHAQRLSKDDQNDEARELCLRLLAEAEGLGLVSAELLWTLAVVADRQGNFPMAVEFCDRAMQADPLDPSVRHSWSVIVNRLRKALLDDDLQVDDAEVPKLYELLAEVSGADEACRVRYGAYLVAVGNTAEARTHLSAVVQLHPRSLDAWTLYAQVAEPGDLERLRGSLPRMSQLRGPQGPYFPQSGPALG
ncbi:MAG: tetratricopeptide repeat protein [Myxococcaceae bacterium]